MMGVAAAGLQAKTWEEMYLACQDWQVRTQVSGNSYTHLASLGVLIWTVARNHNVVPPYRLCPGGKTALGH